MTEPELVVFDLDLTLWDCGGSWCDCLTPPFTHNGQTPVDANGKVVRLYEEVHGIMDQLDASRIPMALASRTQEPEWARELLEMLGITDRFAWSEIYPSAKFQHFAAIHGSSGIAYEKMLFFDDEQRNIDDINRLGVASVYVPSGLTHEVFQQGLQQFGVQVTRLQQPRSNGT